MSLQFDATGTFSDSSTSDITTQCAWTVSDSTLATEAGGTGLLSYANAGLIWGGDVSVTASDAGVVGTSKAHVISTDSGSINPLMPQLNSHWQAIGLSPWGTWFGLQEPSGSMMMGSGNFPFALTASAIAGAGIGPQFQSTEPGWTRNFVVMTGSAAEFLSWPASFGPNTANSFAMLCYAHVGMMGGTNLGIMGVLGASTLSYRISNDEVVINGGQAGANFTNITDNLTGPITQQISDRVHPFLVVYNTSSLMGLMATDVSICTSGSSAGNFAVTNTAAKGLGGNTAATAIPSASYTYFAVCTGSIAEYYSNPQNAGALLNTLGWNCQWASCPVDSGTVKLPFLPFHYVQNGEQAWTATYNLQDQAGASLSTDDVWPGHSQTGLNLISTAVDGYRYNLAAGWTNGWNRMGLLSTQVVTHTNCRVGVVYGPPANLNPTGSFACLAYVSTIPPSVTGHEICGMANSSAGGACMAQQSTSGFPIIYCAGATATGSHSIADGKVHPVLLVQDVTNSRTKLYTDLEAVTGTFQQLQIINSITSSIGFGGQTSVVSSQPVSGVFVYFAWTTGSLAESFSTDGVASAFLKGRGFTVNF